jgi:hypothetical protein
MKKFSLKHLILLCNSKRKQKTFNGDKKYEILPGERNFAQKQHSLVAQVCSTIMQH